MMTLLFRRSKPLSTLLVLLSGAIALNAPNSSAAATRTHKKHKSDTQSTGVTAGTAEHSRKQQPGEGRADPLHEIEGSTLTSLTFGSNLDTRLAIQVGYRQLLPEVLRNIQVATTLGLSTQSALTTLAILLGPSYNLPLAGEGLTRAFFVTGQIGISYTSTALISQTAFAYSFAVGKRFELLHGFTWKPDLAMTGIAVNDAAPAFTFRPIQFSFLF